MHRETASNLERARNKSRSSRNFEVSVERRGAEGVGFGALSSRRGAGGNPPQGRTWGSMPDITLDDLEVARTAVQISDNPTDALKMIEQYMEEIQTANLGEHHCRTPQAHCESLFPHA